MFYEFPDKNIGEFLKIPFTSNQSVVFIDITSGIYSPEPNKFINDIVTGKTSLQMNPDVKILIHAQGARWYIHSKKIDVDFLVDKLHKIFNSDAEMFLVNSIESNYLKKENVQFGSIIPITV